jgi:hypothetical protein
MKTRGMLSCRPLPVCALVLTLLSCAPFTQPDHYGGSQQTGNPVAGILYNSDGTRARNATVMFVPADYDPYGHTGNGSIDSAVTNDTGGYTMGYLSPAMYNVFGKGPGGKSYRDSITVKVAAAPSLLFDTLKAPGSIRGVVQLQPGADARTVFIIFTGAPVLKMPSDVYGNFMIDSLAAGAYKARLLTTLPDYEVMDTSFTITSGVDSVLPDTLKLHYSGIPVPQGLRIEYDTMKQIVTVIWNRPKTGTVVQGYTVYRKRSDSAAFVDIKDGVTDTCYNDSTGVQDRTYEYRVAAADTTTTGAMSAGASVTLASALLLTDSIVSPMINSSQAHNFFVGKDTTIYIAVAGLRNYIRVLSKTGDSINAIGDGVIRQVSDMALDSKENLFAVDPDNSMIFKFLKNGQLVSSWPVTIPTAITIDSMDNVYVIFLNGRGILKLDTAGQHVDSVTFGSGTDEVHFAVAPDGKIFVGRLATNTITAYDANLSATGSFQLMAEGHPQIELQGIDKNGNLYLRYVRSVQPDLEFRVFNSSGSYLAKVQPQRGGDFGRISGNRLYLMGQSGLSIYSVPF